MVSKPIIGLTGGIGSGKSTIARLFNQLGIESVDADDVARQVVAPQSDALKQIRNRYGAQILLPTGHLNRRALRSIVFDNPAEKTWLEGVTHPAIRQSLIQQLENCHSAYALMVHPLLFETQQDTQCFRTIAISVPLESQIERVVERDQTSPEDVQKIINSQLSDQERRSKADFVLENTSNIIDLNGKVNLLNDEILALL
ncbi:dephospho-CoA kinase [Marinomonas epiphytica]